MPEGSAEPPARPARKKRGLLVLAAVAVLAVLAWQVVGHFRLAQFEWNRFAATFLSLNPGWVAAAAALALLTYVGRAIRWAVMLKPLVSRPDLWGLVKVTAIGFTAVVLLGRPGEIVRPYLIALRERVPFSSQVAAWVLERICDLLAVLVIFGYALSQLAGSGAVLGPRFAWLVSIGGYLVAGVSGACLLALLLLNRSSAALRRWAASALRFLPEGRRIRVDRQIGAFLDGTAVLKARGSVFLLVFYTALEWTIIGLCVWCLLQSSPATAGLNVRSVLIFTGFLALGSVVQVPGIGGGVQIVTIVVLTELFGVAIEAATGLALVLWITTFLVILPPGIFLALHEGLNWRRLSELRRRAARAEDTGP